MMWTLKIWSHQGLGKMYTERHAIWLLISLAFSFELMHKP